MVVGEARQIIHISTNHKEKEVDNRHRAPRGNSTHCVSRNETPDPPPQNQARSRSGAANPNRPTKRLHLKWP